MKEYIVFVTARRGDVNIEVCPMNECAGTERVNKLMNMSFCNSEARRREHRGVSYERMCRD